MSIIIDGQKIADHLKEQLAHLTFDLRSESGITPGLAVIRVGEDPVSELYVQLKEKAAKTLDYHFEEHTYNSDIKQSILEDKIRELDKNINIHGIILQLPIPNHLNTPHLLSLIDPSKDVDGLHPFNSGDLMEGFPTNFIPCAPLACLSLIHSVETNLEGLSVGVIGCSYLVGRPMAMLMLKEECTVWMGHIKTKNLKEICKNADILIVAIGNPKFIKGDWIKKGSIVIDVGVNRLDSGAVVGDVDFVSAHKRAKAITPVPGGVGPITVATLMRNTLKAAYSSTGKQFPLETDINSQQHDSQKLRKLSTMAPFD